MGVPGRYWMEELYRYPFSHLACSMAFSPLWGQNHVISFDHHAAIAQQFLPGHHLGEPTKAKVITMKTTTSKEVNMEVAVAV